MKIPTQNIIKVNQLSKKKEKNATVEHDGDRQNEINSDFLFSIVS